MVSLGCVIGPEFCLFVSSQNYCFKSGPFWLSYRLVCDVVKNQHNDMHFLNFQILWSDSDCSGSGNFDWREENYPLLVLGFISK